MRQFKRAVVLALVLLLAAVVYAANTNVMTDISKSGRSPQGVGMFVYTVDQTTPTDGAYDSPSFTGYVERIVIEASGTDTNFDVTLTDPHGVVLFTKLDCSTAADPYAFALYTDDLNGDPAHGVPINGALTVTTAGTEDATASAITVTVYGKEYWR